ncbi:MAG: gfo/Idh/MocA family oxidoreductase, partial [Acidobacteria bacterium]
MTHPLRIAVIGVGHLGRHHARILSTLDGASLVGVVDVKTDRAAEIATAFGTAVVGDARDLLDRVDAVSVAVPTESHLAVALPFLERGIPVLVEKPLARSVAEADRLIEAAGRSGAVL